MLYIVYIASLVTVQRARRGGRYGGAHRADRTIIPWMYMKVGDIYSSNSELQNGCFIEILSLLGGRDSV